MLYLIMELAICRLPFTVDKFKCMRSISIHVTEAVWDSTIAEQERDLMRGLRTQRDEIPKHVHVLVYVFGHVGIM